LVMKQRDDSPVLAPSDVSRVSGPRYIDDSEGWSSLDDLELVPVETPSATPEKSTPRLTVDVKRLIVTLDGQTYDVPSAQALRWLKVLCDHPGEWIASNELKTYDTDLDGARPDRLKKKLPAPVQSLIDSDTGKGSRLRLA